MTFGTVSPFEDQATVRFVRAINAPIDRVWQALTSVDDLGAWLATTHMEPNVGGTVSIDFGDDGKVDGKITVFDPPHTLEYTWTFTGEPDSILRFELAAEGNGTTLVLEHRLLPVEQAAGYAAGWHAHLDAFDAHLAGKGPIDWDARFNEVLGSYVGA